MATNQPPVVPFVRSLTQGCSGPDVVAVKRALSRAGYIEWKGTDFTRVWGPYAAESLKRFEKAKGLKQTGEYSFTRHEALRKTHRKGSRIEWAFDAFSIAIMREEDVSPWERVAYRTVDAVNQAIAHRDQITYSQVRPMPDMAPYPNLPYAADCSGFATWAARSGGWAQDPNYPLGSSRKWDGYGYTGTLWACGHDVSSLRYAKLCDLVFYGRPWLAGGAAHVSIVREIHDGRVYVGSHGSRSGPINVPADYRSITGIRRYVLA